MKPTLKQTQPGEIHEANSSARQGGMGAALRAAGFEGRLRCSERMGTLP